MVIVEKECKRCLHKWIPRTHDEPTVCPECKSPYWNKERGVKESAYKNGFNDGQAEGMSTPCEEQGCTDIENCDEICLHTRIYSPAQFVMRCDIIRKAERERVLEVVDIECQEIQSRIESSAMGNPLSERERGRIIGILDIRVKLDSLRGVNHD